MLLLVVAAFLQAEGCRVHKDFLCWNTRSRLNADSARLAVGASSGSVPVLYTVLEVAASGMTARICPLYCCSFIAFYFVPRPWTTTSIAPPRRATDASQAATMVPVVAHLCATSCEDSYDTIVDILVLP